MATGYENRIARLEEALEEELRAEKAQQNHQTASLALLDSTFEEQRAFILDPSRLKFAFCTRRAAKSYSWGIEALIDAPKYAYANYLFLALVREEARRLFWKDVLKDLDRRYGLGVVFNETTLSALLPNGATIYVGGADSSADEMRKLLGLKYRKIAVDEAQDWLHTDVKSLVYETLRPATVDMRGSISLLGTPGKLAKGFFFDITPPSVVSAMATGVKSRHQGWSGHCWDSSKNPYIAQQWAEEIQELRATHPGIEETPAFRRNYGGEWVTDNDSLCYGYLPGRNDFAGTLPAYPQGRWHYVLGIDLGHSDSSAFVVLAYHDFDPCLYVLEVFKKTQMDFTDVASRVKSFEARYEFDALVIDGANKQGVAEMRKRHGLSLTPAEKQAKSDYIDMMSADFITSKIKLDPAACAPLVEEYASLIWNPKSAKREEHPACENHAADAALYGWRFCFNYLSEPQEKPPAPGSQEWATQEAARMEEQMVEQLERERDILNGDAPPLDWLMP